MNRRIKHTKIKNVSILFEVLARKVTSDILDNNNEHNALKILKEYFNKNTQLRKELNLYRSLMKNKFNSESKASSFIDVIIEARKSLDNKKLRREKYNIIKEIKNNFQLDDLFSIKFDNYNVMASVYKLFEYNTMINETINPEDLIKSKFTVVDYMLKENVNSKNNKNGTFDIFKNENKEVKLLTNKILIDKFNKKYGKKLNENQKALVKEYINNISNSNSLHSFINKNVPLINEQLKSILKNIENTAIKIKIKEVVSQLNKLTENKKIKDDNIVSLMKVYELIDELKRHKCKTKELL